MKDWMKNWANPVFAIGLLVCIGQAIATDNWAVATLLGFALLIHAWPNKR